MLFIKVPGGRIELVVEFRLVLRHPVRGVRVSSALTLTRDSRESYRIAVSKRLRSRLYLGLMRFEDLGWSGAFFESNMNRDGTSRHH